MELKVFTFSPAWGLPSSGPFPLKLIKWLDLSGLPYRQVYEDNTMKAPKRKSPWIELDGEAIADSEIIIDLLSQRSGFDIDAGLSDEQKAVSHAVRRMLEEHLHMIFEYELFVHPSGAAVSHELLPTVPRVMLGPVSRYVSRHMKRQLYARGIARHDEATIARKGRADIDALAAVLGDRQYLAGDRPCMGDVAAYGLVRPMLAWPMNTPVADYVKSHSRLAAYLRRMEDLRAEERLAA
jgi:glutathione S-transferase